MNGYVRIYILNILHIGQYYLINYSYQENYLPKAMRQGGKNKVLYIASKKFPDFFKEKIVKSAYFDDGIYVIHVKMNFGRLVTLVFGLLKIIRKFKPDLIFLHGYAFIKCFYLFPLAKFYHIRICMDIHEDYNNSGITRNDKTIKGKIRIFLYQELNLFYSKLFSKFIFSFYYVAPSIKPFCLYYLRLPPQKIKPLYLGFDYSRININERGKIRKEIEAEYNIQSNRIVVITAGKFDRGKNLPLLLECAKLLKDDNRFIFLIVGKIEDHVKRDVENLLQLPNVIYCGWKSSDILFRYLLAADIAVYPGTQSVLWQQTVCLGTPAIFRYWPGVEYLGKENNEFIYKYDPGEIRDKIIKTTFSYEQLRYKREYALKYGQNNFDYNNQAKLVICDFINSK